MIVQKLLDYFVDKPDVLVYVGSPYTSQFQETMQTRFEAASEYTAFLLNNNIHAWSPIAHCHPIAVEYELPRSFDFWGDYNKNQIKRCDLVLIMTIQGWKISAGVQQEIEFAQNINMPIILSGHDFGDGLAVKAFET